ncbi:MAG: hypothetical protein ACI4DO_02705 [Roseburia sp.]
MKTLVAMLENTDTYDKENALIDIYIYLLENKINLNEGQQVFVELSKLRDRTLSDGSESYFEEFNRNGLPIEIISKYASRDVVSIYTELSKSGKYDEIDEWMSKNEWLFNEELSAIIKASLDNV